MCEATILLHVSVVEKWAPQVKDPEFGSQPIGTFFPF